MARRGDRPKTHDQPIIIDGTGSVILEFDDLKFPPHYFEVSESVYAGVGLFLHSLSVRTDPDGEPGSGEPCALPGSICTIAVGGKHPQNQDGSIIRVRGMPGGIVISVAPEKYTKENTGSNRKRHRNRGFKIDSLTIRDAITDDVIRDYSDLLLNNGKCFIDIIDEHILGDIEALAERFDARAE